MTEGGPELRTEGGPKLETEGGLGRGTERGLGRGNEGDPGFDRGNPTYKTYTRDPHHVTNMEVKNSICLEDIEPKNLSR